LGPRGADYCAQDEKGRAGLNTAKRLGKDLDFSAVGKSQTAAKTLEPK
jgi:hypothetical protein